MKKCYIAGKIGDLPEAEFKRNFVNAKAEVALMGLEPVSPVDLLHDHNKSWISYMKEDLKAMMDCDVLYAMRNWRQSPGATIEVNLALQLGIQIIHQPHMPKDSLFKEGDDE